MKKHFITGLVIVLPLVLTLVILSFLLKLLTKPFEGIAVSLLEHFNLLGQSFLFFNSKQVLNYFSQMLIIVVLFLLTLLMGFLARWFFFHEIIKLSDWAMHRIPLINKIYKASQETVTTLFSSQSRTFREVVLVPFPHFGGRSLGFVTADRLHEKSHEQYQNMITVFVPGTPNPTVGLLILYRRDQVVPLNLSVEQAIKCVISCGVMLPTKENL